MRGLWTVVLLATAAGAFAEEAGGALPAHAARCFGDAAGVHPDDISDLAVSPDGKWVATACGDDRVRVWSLEDLRLRQNLDSGQVGTDFVCWTADNRVAFARENAIVICSPESGEEESLYGPEAWLRTGAVSADGKFFAAATDKGQVFVWDAGSGKFLRRFDVHEEGERRDIERIAWSPGSQRLWTLAREGVVRGWNSRTGAKEVQLEGASKGVGGIAVSPDGASLVTADPETDEIAFWDLASGNRTRTLKLDRLSHGSSPALSPDGTLLAACVIENIQGVIDVWSLSEPKRRVRIPAPGHDPDWMAFHPDGKRLISAGGDDLRLRVWDVETGAERTPGSGHTDKVLLIRPLEGGKRLLTAGADGRITIWPAGEGAPPARTVRSGILPVAAAAASADATRVWLGGGSGDIELWDVATGRVTASFKGDGKAIQALAVPDDGRALAVSRWEPNVVGIGKGDLTGGIRSCEPSTRIAQPVVFAPGGEWLVTAGTDAVRLRAPDSGAAWAEWDLKVYTHSIALSPDASLLAIAAMDSLVVVEIATGEVVHKSPRKELHSTIVAFSRDGNDLYLGSRKGDIEVVDLRDGSVRLELKGHSGAVTALAAGPTDDVFYSGGADGCVWEWRLPARPPAEPLPAALADASAWSALAGLSAPEAFARIERLRDAPEKMIAELAGKLLEFPEAGPTVAGLLKELDAEDPDARRSAAASLRQMGDLAEQELRKAAGAERPAESKAAVASLLDVLATPLQHSPEMLRRARALRLLERHRGATALEALQKLSEKSPFTRERRLATLAARRMKDGR